MSHPELEKLGLFQYLKFRLLGQVFLKDQSNGRRWWLVKCEDCGEIYKDYEHGYQKYTRCPNCYEPPIHSKNWANDQK